MIGGGFGAAVRALVALVAPARVALRCCDLDDLGAFVTSGRRRSPRQLTAHDPARHADDELRGSALQSPWHRRSHKHASRHLVALVLATSSGACSAVPPASAPSALAAENLQARQLLCGDVGEATCLDACPESLDSRAHADCLLRLRFASDPEALDLARSLYSATNALVGIDVSGTIDGYRGENVELFPALPIGEHRHHLEWIRTSLVSFEAFVESLAAHAPRPVSFQPRPRGFVFFQTATLSYPSAYCSDGLIGYNVRGPLHANQRDMHETLFHELFHLNDAMRSGGWSARALGPLFSSILDRCGDDHACFAPFAPHGTIVPDGTFYAFDRRTRDVREYAAELALRYFLEHEEILAGGAARRPAFKCLTDENQAAWSALVNEFFGGVDLTPSCDR